MILEIVMVIFSACTSGAVAVMVYMLNKKADRRHDEERAMAEYRAKASKVQMDLIIANGELAYACAIALKRGKANGEVEEAVAVHERAKRQYLDFINDAYFEYKEGVKQAKN